MTFINFQHFKNIGTIKTNFVFIGEFSNPNIPDQTYIRELKWGL